MLFLWNLTGFICSSSAYCTGFGFEWFLAKLWPLNNRVFCVCCQLHRILTGLLLGNYWCKFIQTLQDKQSKNHWTKNCQYYAQQHLELIIPVKLGWNCTRSFWRVVRTSFCAMYRCYHFLVEATSTGKQLDSLPRWLNCALVNSMWLTMKATTATTTIFSSAILMSA
jgi:hypothetical protein